MYKIIKKQMLCKTVCKMIIEAPLVAKNAQPGQFVIIRSFDDSERIPLTIADYNSEIGEVTIIFQLVGEATIELNSLKENDLLCDIVGPLGKPSEIKGLKRVAVIGGGVGCAIAYPIVKALKMEECYVDSIIGFRSKELVILQKEFTDISDTLTIMTDDGSHGQKGLVTAALERLIANGNQYDEVIAIGPIVMMKFVSEVTKKYNIKTTVSMNPIMIDGTGMCGGCRLTVGGKTMFACVDGPDFDGHLVDFDEAMARGGVYRVEEECKKNSTCNLFKGENR